MKKIFPVLTFLLFTFAGSAEILRDSAGKPVRYAGKFNSSQVNIRDFRPKKDEFRGIWIAVVENIDFKKHSTVQSFQSDFRQAADRAKNAGFTAIIFQIRSNCDAFYPSALAPWSRWLSGQEGVGLGNFDPLRFMIDETHKRGMEFHAWFNPYRVIGNTPLSKNAYLKTLAANNFARRNPNCVLVKKNPAGNQLFLDPGMPQVQTHLCQIIGEVVQRYRVDAIHFDDYFYPYEKLGSEDAATFRKYNPQKLSLDNWRRKNTDDLIYQVRLTITRNNIIQKRQVKFGTWC